MTAKTATMRIMRPNKMLTKEEIEEFRPDYAYGLGAKQNALCDMALAHLEMVERVRARLEEMKKNGWSIRAPGYANALSWVLEPGGEKEGR